MKELEELKAAIKDLKFISERNLFIIQLEHKVEALEEVLTKRNLTSKSSRPDKAEAQLQTFDGITSEATNTNNQQSGG